MTATNLLSHKDMPLVTVDALTREELLAISARRWDALRAARPDLAPAVDLQQRLLTIVIDAAHAIGSGRLPRLSLPPKYLAAKLGARRPGARRRADSRSRSACSRRRC